MEKNQHISLHKVSTNNLKQIDVTIPLNQLTVVTGVSGSGKSSLVFDTLYAEAYRRFVDSLSSYARQYLKTLPKPDLQSVSNLPPAVAVKQGRSPANQRSTVGTLTELTHLIQTLFMHLGKIQCYKCGRPVQKDHARSIVDNLLQDISTDTQLAIMAPLKGWSGLKGSALKKQLQEQGFVRVSLDSEIFSLEDIDLKKIHSSNVIIDRLKCKPDEKTRLTEAVELALKVGRGLCLVGLPKEELRFSNALECTHCRINYLPASMVLFSFNHPLGACDSCHGYGRIANLDWDKVIPDKNSSIAQDGIAPLNFGSHAEYYSEIKKSAKKLRIDLKKAFHQYTEREWQWLREGSGADFGGMKAYFEWLNSKKYKAHYRIHAAKYNKYEICPSCNGRRYCRDALVYKIEGKNISDVHEMAIKDFKTWLSVFNNAQEASKSSPEPIAGLSEALEEIESRIRYLVKVGLSYLNLNRVSGTLSGGELQRIHMASCIGSSLTDTMYCLDEPTAGLHARDSQNLLDVICELRDQGNTVVIVEHDKQIMNGSDFLIEIGPGSGHLGGHISYEGKAKSRSSAMPYPERPARKFGSYLKLEGAKTHNLKNIGVEFPMGGLSVVCGVSGSGKTSLIQHTLFPMLESALGNRPMETIPAKSIGPKSVLDKIAQVLFIDQKTLARSSRSNIATYLGIFEAIRKLFSSQERAKELKLGPGSFSFNVPGGRCETCKGLGTVIEDLSFLGEVQVTCPQCEGKRFSSQVLSVTVRGQNLLQILSLTVHQAFELFYDHGEIRDVLKPIIDLGLGYLTLGQSTNSFSGGEAQRLKLLSLLKETHSKSKSMLLIFDEPTTGLSDKDVYNLWKHLDFLTQKGHTVIVIEHHLDMIRHADWLIEIGPDAADLGGQVVYQGSPGGIFSAPLSKTAPFLKS
uniref:UvrABC system protein A n=1 Tax=uncultured bacterium Ak20-3 TaxID=798570 RepID=D9MX69_9BACT|nr:hypothetical protein AKSOIL_0338 [uncultured bacterium Ak20-3]